MTENHMALKEFVVNFFNLEKYLQPHHEHLNDDEIDDLLSEPEKHQSDRELMDRLLNDGEAVEIIIDQGKAAETASLSGASNVFSFSERKKGLQDAKPIRNFLQANTKKVAASSDLKDPEHASELKYEDELLEIFIQIVAYKEGQFLISGHFRLKDKQPSLRLIFPDGSVMTDFKEENGLQVFRIKVSERFKLSDICYELY
ncbi:MAG: hypothetical protein HQ517_02765, partial [SAR324 cluster bacterium]|nr:hypothetical protein [SAR324 cluster bacterium]